MILFNIILLLIYLYLDYTTISMPFSWILLGIGFISTELYTIISPLYCFFKQLFLDKFKGIPLPIEGNITFFCTDNTGEGGTGKDSRRPTYSASENLRNEFSNRLASLSYQIEFGLRNLQRSNLEFEKLFDNWKTSKEAGDLASAARYADMARTERSRIQALVPLLEGNIRSRSDIAEQAQNAFRNSEFRRFTEIRQDADTIISIGSTLANNSMYNT